jgi:hypothetical protein
VGGSKRCSLAPCSWRFLLGFWPVFCRRGGTFKEIWLWVKQRFARFAIRLFRSDFCAFLAINTFRSPDDFDSLVDLRPGFGFEYFIPLLHFLVFFYPSVSVVQDLWGFRVE